MTGKKMTAMKNILLIALSALMFGACTRDPMGRGNPVGPNGETLVKLSIRTPAGYNTRAADTDYRVEQVSVLVFEKSGSDYLFDYMAQGYQLATEGLTTTFVANLVATPNPIKLLIVANHAIDPASIEEGDNENDLRDELTTTFSNMADVMPMYGEKNLDAGLSASNHNIDVTMLRAFARATVTVDLEPGSLPFTMTCFYVFRANNEVQVIPNLSSMSSIVPPDIRSASVPAEAIHADPYIIVGEQQAYISESLPVDDPVLQVTEPTCIVVAGHFNGALEDSYYRIDFNGVDQLLTRQPFGQILRNYDYQFTIKSVLSKGWPSAQEAADNIASNIIAEMAPWNTLVSQLYVGDPNGVFAMLEQNEVVLSSAADSEATFEFTTSEDLSTLGIADFAYGFPTAVIPEIDYNDAGASNLEMDILVSLLIHQVKDYGTYRVYTFKVETVVLNNTGATIEDLLVIRLGEWLFGVRIKQLSTNEEPLPVVNVLSFGVNVGSFGGPTSAIGTTQALKDMLSNPVNFGVTSEYVNTIRGFNFIGDDLSLLTSDSYNSALEMALAGADVVLLPYSTNPTANASTLIKQWVEGDNNRVLIVMSDASTTNTNVRALLDPSLTWQTRSAINDLLSGIFGILLGGSPTYEGFVVADYTDDNAIILRDGPFGPVANVISTVVDGDDDIEGDIFTGSDAISQFVQELPANFAPLVNYAASSRDGIIILGDISYAKLPASPIFFDPARRIIYIGEGQTMQTIYDNINSNEAIDGSPMNTMYLNLWAWIANTVVAP